MDIKASPITEGGEDLPVASAGKFQTQVSESGYLASKFEQTTGSEE